MYCEIYYNKAFIKVQDKYIPMVCHGASNCWIASKRGMRIPEKHWVVLSYPQKKGILFSKQEIEELAEYYDKLVIESEGGIHKSRHQVFGKGEFGRWVRFGMLHARTVEDYVKAGNKFFFTAQSQGIKMPIKTECQLIDILNDYSKDTTVKLYLDNRDLRKVPINQKSSQTDFSVLSEYYVIKTCGGYVMKLDAKSIWYTTLASAAKKFVTVKEAETFIKRRPNKFDNSASRVVCIRNGVEV